MMRGRIVLLIVFFLAMTSLCIVMIALRFNRGSIGHATVLIDVKSGRILTIRDFFILHNSTVADSRFSTHADLIAISPDPEWVPIGEVSHGFFGGVERRDYSFGESRSILDRFCLSLSEAETPQKETMFKEMLISLGNRDIDGMEKIVEKLNEAYEGGANP